MSIVAYSYLAALHCPSCTRHALCAYRQQIMRPYPDWDYETLVGSKRRAAITKATRADAKATRDQT